MRFEKRALWIVEECVDRKWRPVENDIHFSTESAGKVELDIWEMDCPGCHFRLVEYVPKVKK